ncbi:MAG: archaeosortase/exosortase family protein, partial [Ignisphaera sp.]
MSIAILLTLYITYNDFLNAYIEILKMENYSYLIAIIPISVVVLYKLLLSYFEIEGINILRLLGSTTLFLFSILFYLIGDIINEFFLEFKALSIVCLLWSSLTLFFRPKSFAIAYLSIAILLTFVPIPRQAVDYLSSILTRVVASAVSTITSTQVVEREGMLML